MTVITFKRWDLERLVGTELSDEELRQVLNRLKGEVESIEGDEVRMEVTHDRPDMFSVEGIARAVKGLLEIELGLPRLEVKERAYLMRVENVPHRPYIVTCIVRDVELDDEAIRQLMQLQEKLHQTYGRDRRLFAIGLYDADKVKFPITYRLLKLDEIRYRPLGHEEVMTGWEVLEKTGKGQQYRHLAVYQDCAPVIQDAEGNIMVLIPVLNSEDYKVTESTRNVLVDVTGPSLKHVLDVMKILLYNIAERSKSKTILLPRIEGVDYEQKLVELYTPQRFEITEGDIEDLAGIKLSRDEIAHYLKMCRHDVEVEKDKLIVHVAPYRINVLHKVDLVEDVLIAYGYDKIPRELPAQTTHGAALFTTRLVDQIREVLRGLGFKEISNYVMTSRRLLELTEQASGVIEVVNPKSELFNCLRTAIWPQLLEVLKLNEDLIPRGLRVFDVGEIARYTETGDVICELHLAMAISSPEVTVTDMLVYLKTLFRELGLQPTYVKARVPGLIPERTAKIIIRNEEVGVVGEVHPEVLTRLELYYPVAVCELNLDKLARLLRE